MTAPSRLPMLSAPARATEPLCRGDAGQCIGCCVDPRAGRDRLERLLAANTDAYARRLAATQHPTRIDYFVHELRRRRGFDLLATALAVLPPWAWPRLVYDRRRTGCVYAGYLDERRREVGCLLHPSRHGGRDHRPVAFLTDPLRWCNPEFLCAAARAGERVDRSDWFAYTRTVVERNRALRSRPRGGHLRAAWRSLGALLRRKRDNLLRPLPGRAGDRPR